MAFNGSTVAQHFTTAVNNFTTGMLMDANVTYGTTPSEIAASTPANDGYGAVNAAFVLLCTVLIFTMQTGFGLLESGLVSRKNEVNLMYINCTATVTVGTMYWLLGYAFSFGDQEQTWCKKDINKCRGFTGVGDFAMEELGEDPLVQGARYVNFCFQLSFASASATIVSGALAERIKVSSYLLLSAFNLFGYVFPSHWIWDSTGWLYQRGVVDIAGSGVVHLCGGTAALVYCLLLGPRKGRYDHGRASLPVSNGVNVILGVFFLWWGWLGFNCGSVYLVSNGAWVTVAKTMVTTLLGSFGGGLMGILWSIIMTRGRIYNICDLANGILAGLVSVTAGCSVIHPWEGFVIGAIGGLIGCAGGPLFDLLHIDDPVGSLPVHFLGGLWGLLAVGLFMQDDESTALNRGNKGAFWSHNGSSFRDQVVAACSIIVWSGLVALIIGTILKFSPLGFRMTPEEEEAGADSAMHGIQNDAIETSNYNYRDTKNGYGNNDGPPPSFENVERASANAFKQKGNKAEYDTEAAERNMREHFSNNGMDTRGKGASTTRF